MNKELIAEELEQLKIDGELQAQAVVDYAKKHPESELHKHFNWNVKEAANAYWLQQARYVISRCVVVTYEEKGDEPIQVRAFFREGKPENEDETRASGYVSTATVLEDPVQRRNLLITVIKRALAELNSYPVPELKPLITLANKLLAKYRQAEKEVEVK